MQISFNPIAYLRAAAVLAIILFGTLLVFLLSIVPFNYQGSSWSAWTVTWMARLFLKVMPARFECGDRERIRQHRGFIFPNHDAFLDGVVLMSIRPMRFLAAVEVEQAPFVGRIARAVGTIFVDRSSKASRQQAREALATLSTEAPIVLFPEGIIDRVTSVSPFRYGAFEIAKQANLPYLPTAIVYDPFDVAEWQTANIIATIWQFVNQAETTTIRMIALAETQPMLPAPTLAQNAQQAIQAALFLHGGRAYQTIGQL